MEQDEGQMDLGNTMVTAVCWVSRGYAKPQLDDYEPDEAEIKQHAKLQKKLAKGADIGTKDVAAAAKEIEKNLDDMNLDEEPEDDGDDLPVFTPELARLKAKELGQVVESEDQHDEDDQEGVDDEMAEDAEPDTDTKKEYPEEFSDSEEEKEDYTIRRTDSLIVAATAQNDHSNLEVYIYEHNNANLYVHHEIILSSYPLCLEWLPSMQGQKANMMIVGSFLPEIEIYNLDSENCDPVGVLGCVKLSEEAKEKKVVSKYKKGNPEEAVGFSEETHTDAVMSLSLNPFQSEYLASGSADKTVRIWDLDELAIKATYAKLHTDKVQAVRWNKLNESILLSGGYDGRLNIVDVRQEDKALRFQMDKLLYRDLESANWHPKSEHNFVVSTESGDVLGFDTRNFTVPLFTLAAHKKGACASAVFSPHFASLMATVGTDKTCKIWDISQQGANGLEPLLVHSKDMKQGDLFSVQFYEDIPWVLATGGQNGELAVWDTEECTPIVNHFKPTLDSNAGIKKKKADQGMAEDEEVQEDDNDSGFEDLSEDEDKEDKEVIKASKKGKKASSKN